MKDPAPRLALQQYALANGLAVTLHQDRSLPLVAVNLNYGVGSKNERPGRTGLAHLFEHLMFQGSARYEGDFFRPLQEIGASANAATNTDRTRYWELLPSSYLDRALWLEADRMGSLLEALTVERLRNQVAVVQNERRQNYEERPYGTVWEKMLAVLYPPNHPYAWPTIGSMADLDAATLDDAREFFRTFYTPNNASLCIAGDFDLQAARELVDRHFAAIPPGPAVARIERWMPSPPGEVVLAIEDRVHVPRSSTAWPTVPVYSPDDAALDLFARVLGGGRTSRLHKQLVHDRQIAQDATLSHVSSQLAGVMRLVLTPRPGHDLPELERAARDVIDEALATGLTDEEVARAKTAVVAAAVRSLQHLGGFGGVSDRLNEYRHYLGRPDMLEWDVQRFVELDPEVVAATAARHIGVGRVVARVTPSRPLAPAGGRALAREVRGTMPGPARERAFTLPARQHFTLANGLAVVLVERRSLPLVHGVLVVRGGTSADPADRPGLTSLAASLTLEGAGGRTGAEIADRLEAIGAELAMGADVDAVAAGFSTLASGLDDVLAIVADVVARPDFTAAELERQRASRLVRLAQLSDVPAYLADTALQRAVFADHPYGMPRLGTPESVAAIGPDEVSAHWRWLATPASATLAVAGDVDRERLEAALGGSLAAWAGGPAPSVKLPTPKPLTRLTIFVVDRPGSTQSVIAVGTVGAARSSPDYPALQVLNTVLGGQFVSRLNLNLREDKGYTYGARSAFEFNLVPGAFSATAQVHTAAAADALRELLAEIRAIAGERPVTPNELAYAVAAITRGYPRRFEGGDQVARALAEVALYRLPPDSLERYPDEVGAVTLAEVTRVARAALDPDRVAIVVVGDRAAIEDGLRGLDLGEVVALDDAGRPAPERRSRARARTRRERKGRRSPQR